MKRNRMILILMMVLTAAAMIGFSGCGSDAEKQKEALEKEKALWTISGEHTPIILPEKLQKAFSEVDSKREGSSLMPMALIAQKSGEEGAVKYLILCKTTLPSEKDPEFAYKMIDFQLNKDGKGEILKETDFNYWAYALMNSGEITADKFASSGWKMPDEILMNPLSAKTQKIFDQVVRDSSANNLKPLLFLASKKGKKEVEYAFLCYSMGENEKGDTVQAIIVREEGDRSVAVISANALTPETFE